MIPGSDFSTEDFTDSLYQLMQQVHPGVKELEPLEFSYCLEPITPRDGWQSVIIPPHKQIEQMISQRSFYEAVQLRPKQGGHIVMDQAVLSLTQALLVGLVSKAYTPAWLNQHFYFDLRGFYFLHRTQYLSPQITDHLGGAPYKQFAPLQEDLRGRQSVGYKDFMAANAEVDDCLLNLVHHLVQVKGTPLLIAVAGQTAAGKTEIVDRLRNNLEAGGHLVTTIEMDNFLTDRDQREARGIDSLGRQALHFEMFLEALQQILDGKQITTPRYDFIQATSSHDLEGRLKPGQQGLIVPPADIIFMEGNAPFLYPEVARLIGIKIVYLTDDAMRLQRKWKRDMDYRKKYDLMYFLNRYFREQFLMAESVYRPQMTMCDVMVDTSAAAVWLTPEFRQLAAKFS